MCKMESITYIYLRPSSFNDSNLTSSRGMTCCLLYFFLLMTMLPYTRMSLNRKNWRALGFLRHIFVRTPSPTRTRPCSAKGWNESKNEIYTLMNVFVFVLLLCLKNIITTHLKNIMLAPTFLKILNLYWYLFHW